MCDPFFAMYKGTFNDALREFHTGKIHEIMFGHFIFYKKNLWKKKLSGMDLFCKSGSNIDILFLSITIYTQTFYLFWPRECSVAVWFTQKQCMIGITE